MPFFSASDDGNPDALLLQLRLIHFLHQPMKPDTGVHHHALHPVLTHQDAALGVFCLVADMNTENASCQEFEGDILTQISYKAHTNFI